MAYGLMKQLIKNVRDGRTVQSKADLLDKCDAFLAADRITTEQYAELVAEINALTTE